VEAQLKVSFPEALHNITDSGHPITDQDFGDIVSLYKRYSHLEYHGVSGKIRFDSRGENLEATMRVGNFINQGDPMPSCQLPLAP